MASDTNEVDRTYGGGGVPKEIFGTVRLPVRRHVSELFIKVSVVIEN